MSADPCVVEGRCTVGKCCRTFKDLAGRGSKPAAGPGAPLEQLPAAELARKLVESQQMITRFSRENERLANQNEQLSGSKEVVANDYKGLHQACTGSVLKYAGQGSWCCGKPVCKATVCVSSTIHAGACMINVLGTGCKAQHMSAFQLCIVTADKMLHVKPCKGLQRNLLLAPA